jgi:hypothetical protein
MNVAAALVLLLGTMADSHPGSMHLADNAAGGHPAATSGDVPPVAFEAEPMVLVAPQPVPAYPFRLHTKYRYLLHRGAYYQRSYDYHRLFDYPWHSSPGPSPATPWRLGPPVGP